MYDKIFSKIYDEYGWDYFSLTMGKSILDYFKVNNIIIKNNLDLCCGTGVLCDYFYKNNIKTKGIDISKYMLQIAKNKNNNIEFKNENVVFYKDSEKYDLVTMTCDAINHIIKEGKKVIETRSWKTSYRGELYIHASNKKIKRSDAHTSELLKLIPNVPMGYGNIICKCRLVDCVYMDQEFLDMIQKDKQEFLCGEYSLGRYAWILEDVEILEKPIPAKGHLNIWNYEVSE